MAVIKRVLCPRRLRKVPSQFSWIDHRLVRDRHVCRCSHQGLALYLFLVTVCDGQGLSYYSDASIMRLLKLDRADLARARQELINARLIAYQCPLYQVLALEALPRQVVEPPGMSHPAGTGPPVALSSPRTQPTPRTSPGTCSPEPGEPTRLDQILRRLIDSAQERGAS
jgi:hypothetical protein